MTEDALPLPLAGSRRRSTGLRRAGFGISKLGVTLFTASLAMIFLLDRKSVV